jgi:hypothetical protein
MIKVTAESLIKFLHISASTIIVRDDRFPPIKYHDVDEFE